PDSPDSLVVAVSEGPLTGISDVRPGTLGGLDTKSAVELLSRAAGSVRVTVDPRAAEGLAEQCQGQPAALVVAGGWLAARPQAAVADLAKQLHTETDEGTPVGRAVQLVHAALPAPAARTLRLLSLAPAGLADPHIASALAGCSVSSARTTLDDFASLGLLHRVSSPLPQYEVPGCLHPLLRGLAEVHERPAELQLARARMLERTVRLLQSCRAITETDSPRAREKLLGMPRSLRFPHPRAAAASLRLTRPAPPAPRPPPDVPAGAGHGGALRHPGRRERPARPARTGPGRGRAARPEPGEGGGPAEPGRPGRPDRTHRRRPGPLPGRAGRRPRGARPVRHLPGDGVRRRRAPGAGRLRPGLRLGRPRPDRAARARRSHRGRPPVRPDRRRPHLRRPLRRSAAELAGRGRLVPQERRSGRPGPVL